MENPEAEPLEDPRFDALLASAHEALVAGTPLPADDTLPPELAERLRRGVDCLRRLESVRRERARVGRFELRRELGRGGFATVYLAWDPEAGREVALKVPNERSRWSHELCRRFLREAYVSAGLDHPNVIPVYEAGEVDGTWYIVSAYCDGPNLADWLAGQKAPVPPREAAALVAALADGVQYVHDEKVLHRDIKPSNVLLQREGPADGAEAPPGPGAPCTLRGERYTPRLTDFGLAKHLDSDTCQTASGGLIGTLPYLAPEQADGRLADMGPPTDVYALGGLLYELLTGRPPFAGKGYAEKLRLITSAEPVPPRRLRRDVPRALQAICLKCLEKQPRRRYATAAELAAQLRRYLAGQRVTDPSPWARAWAWLRRRRAFAALAAVTVALPLLLLAVWHSASGQPPGPAEGPPPPPYVETIYQADRKLADGLAGEADELLERLRPRPGAPDRRGFEWWCLKRLCLPPPVAKYTVLRNPHAVVSLALSPDGKTMAWGDAGGRVVLYDLPTGTACEPLQTDARDVYALAFSPNGKVLASSGRFEGGQYTVTLWDVAARRKRGAPLVGPAPSVNRLAFSPPDGRWLAVGTSPGAAPAQVALWDWQNPAAKPFYLFDDRGPQHSTALAFSPDGHYLVAGSDRLVLWDMERAKDQIAAERVDERGVLRRSSHCRLRDVGWRPGEPTFWDVAWCDTTTLATACWDRKVEVVRLNLPAAEGTVLGEHRAKAFCVAYSPDGALLASGGGEVPNTDKNNEVKVWEAETGYELATFEGHTGEVRALAFTKDDRALVTASVDGTVRLWDVSRLPRRPARLPVQPVEVWSAAYSPDGRLLATAGDNGLLKLWDATTGKELATLREDGPAGALTPLLPRAVFSPDGKTLAAGDYDGYVRLWDVSAHRLLWKWRGHEKMIYALAFSPDGQLLATASRDHSAKLWDVATCDVRHTLRGHTDDVHSVAFAPDGKVLATASHDKTVRFWNVATGVARPEQLTDAGELTCVAYSPDGATLAWAGNAGVIHLRDLATGKERPLAVGHKGTIRSLAFTPDGRTLASASEDHTVRLWCPATGREFLTLRGHNEKVYGLAFDPQGKTLASVCHDGTVRLWRADPEEADR